MLSDGHDVAKNYKFRGVLEGQRTSLRLPKREATDDPWMDPGNLNVPGYTPLVGVHISIDVDRIGSNTDIATIS